MKRLKMFFKYALCIAIFWFLSDFLIYMGIKGIYKTIEAKVMTEVPTVNVAEAKATYVNGYVKGNIYNNTNDTINNKYLKIACYSPRNMFLGTKYVKIENLESKKTQDFEMWFKYTDVGYCEISVVDSANDASEKAFLSEETKYYMVLGFLVSLYFI